MREQLALLRERFFPVRDIYSRLDALDGSIRQAPPTRPPVILHIHIPKTAGTSLNKALFEAFTGRRTASYGSAEWQQFIQAPPVERHQLDLLVGHMTYGVHEHLRPNYLYVFLVRSPRARIFSYYRYLCTREDHPLFPLAGGAGLTFADFLDMSREHRALQTELDNRQVQQVAGNGQLPGETFRIACQHAFDSRTLFGVSERLGPFLTTLCGRGILREVREEHENETGSSIALDETLATLDDSQRELLDGYCRWDDTFYRICEAAAP